MRELEKLLKDLDSAIAEIKEIDLKAKEKVNLTVLTGVVNATIHHVLVLPLMGHFKGKPLAFAFASQNESGSELGNSTVWFLDPAQLTCPTHACGK
ncbi:hypothetical protein DSO57_1035653 [Entomophthora muscae]|uniref:Uncharacterized protein n=1 Tax=Entomophthora muscae TaxID=34485 RepID=A0ACC2SNN7_9FUNG|nr:hypothetical protein DSO57_1035653 [Entomophthora muscae]